MDYYDEVIKVTKDVEKQYKSSRRCIRFQKKLIHRCKYLAKFALQNYMNGIAQIKQNRKWNLRKLINMLISKHKLMVLKLQRLFTCQCWNSFALNLISWFKSRIFLPFYHIADVPIDTHCIVQRKKIATELSKRVAQGHLIIHTSFAVVEFTSIYNLCMDFQTKFQHIFIFFVAFFRSIGFFICVCVVCVFFFCFHSK